MNLFRRRFLIVAGAAIAGDDAEAIAVASGLIREIGYEPVLIGGLAMGEIPDSWDPARGRAQRRGDSADCGGA
jgi:predicted dinucleotide-binding enzyme